MKSVEQGEKTKKKRFFNIFSWKLSLLRTKNFDMKSFVLPIKVGKREKKEQKITLTFFRILPKMGLLFYWNRKGNGLPMKIEKKSSFLSALSHYLQFGAPAPAPLALIKMAIFSFFCISIYIYIIYFRWLMMVYIEYTRFFRGRGRGALNSQ